MLAPLKTWLNHCDKNHECYHRSHDNHWMPSRLLNVSPSAQPNEICLETKFSTKSTRYIALSYCWGQDTVDKARSWRTIVGNLHERCDGFMLSDLPKTLRDAVMVTRHLGVQYLWVDSLCIIQGGDGGRDWGEESKRMEAVYASAYCTIAATAAPDSRSGFLKTKDITNRIDLRCKTSQILDVSTIISNLDADINDAPLNKRAWVTQERYLSARTIHFCTNRVYVECGKGVYAGDNILLQR